MFTPRSHSTILHRLAFLIITTAPIVRAEAQDFSLRVGEGNRALSEAFFPAESAGPLKGGFYYGLDGTVTYDSNFFISDDYTQSELTTAIAPWMVYRSDPEGGADFSFEARYSPVFQIYANNSDFNGVDHTGGASFTYSATRTTIKVYADYSQVSMSDRLAAGFIQGSILNYGITGSYQLASRTSLLAGWSAATSDYDSGARSGADIYTSEVSGLWDATERLRIGPSVQHTLTESDSTGERDAIGLLVKTRYHWGERILIDGSGGVEFSKNSRSGDDGREAGLTGRISVDYAFNDRWTFRGALRYSTVPSPTNLNYLVNDLSFTSAIIRSFDRATLEFGLVVSSSDYEAVGLVAGNRQDDDYLSGYLTYRRKLFSDRISSDISLRCSTNDGQNEWSQWQLSTGIKVEY